MKTLPTNHVVANRKAKKTSQSVTRKQETGSGHGLSRLQETHGNQRVLRMIDRSSGQAPVAGNALEAPGRPLDAGTRSLMESRLGHPFDDVQIHTGSRAAESAGAMNARAFTVGRHIVFSEGAYQPGTTQGEKLLAHELAHIAQPRSAEAGMLSKAGDASEREADRAASAVISGKQATVGAAAGAAIQRQEFPNVMSGKLGAPSGDELIENAGPLLASALGSATLDDFDTGKATLKRDHERKLSSAARSIGILLRKYGTSSVEVSGFADTVGVEAKNLTLGQDRADAVKQALIERGVPEDIISATTRGEGGPQAETTKNEIPSAKNRRVEVKFRPGKSRPSIMGGTLTPPDITPDKGPGPGPFPPPVVDVCRPPFRCPGPNDISPDIYKPIPPPIKGTGPKSVIDVIGEKILDPVIDAVAGGLSKEKRDWLKEKARGAVESGVAKGAKTAAEAAGVTDSASLDAIEKAAEAAIKEKGQKR